MIETNDNGGATSSSSRKERAEAGADENGGDGGAAAFHRAKSTPQNTTLSSRPTLRNVHTLLRPHSNREEEIQRLIDNVPFVIFPDNTFIKVWDMIILSLLVFYIFAIPYQVGVSGGFYLLVNLPWLVINVTMNALFFLDTILYFWRAYRDENTGRIVFNLSTIRRHYLRTYLIPNLISSVPSTLMFYFASWNRFDLVDNHPSDCTAVALNGGISDANDDNFEELESGEGQNFAIILLLNLLKLARFFRLNAIFQSSVVLNDIKEHYKSHYLELIKYTLGLVVVSHLFACVWCFMAYISVGTFGCSLGDGNNWIALWYSNSYEPGSINPIGWTNDTDRYVLSLFWAIQTITSIGYGNISPYNRMEWWASCLLMLLAGIMWAYVIGGLVGVATAWKAEEDVYRMRTDQAHALVQSIRERSSPRRHGRGGCFGGRLKRGRRRDTTMSTTAMQEQHPPHEDDMPERTDDKVVVEQIRRYLQTQKARSKRISCASDLYQTYPILESLTPELQLMSSYLLLKDDVNAVRYLSSRYLNVDEQALVAIRCISLEFGAGECIDLGRSGLGSDLGRGICILKLGCAVTPKGPLVSHPTTGAFRLYTVGSVIGADSVLLEDSSTYLPSPKKKPCRGEQLHFMTFSRLTFIPRTAVLEALERNPGAWKDCARWMYCKALLISHAKSTSRSSFRGGFFEEKTEEDDDDDDGAKVKSH